MTKNRYKIINRINDVRNYLITVDCFEEDIKDSDVLYTVIENAHCMLSNLVDFIVDLDEE